MPMLISKTIESEDDRAFLEQLFDAHCVRLRRKAAALTQSRQVAEDLVQDVFLYVAARKCGITPSEYIRQRTLGGGPKTMLPDTFFVCCEKLDRLTRAPYAKDVNDAALAVLIEMRNILTDKTVIPAEKEEAKLVLPEPKPKHRLFGRR